ncbi:pimeloyl-ACP methyl ester carboxylesterase [Neorhizobium galegae]|nr:pimeloyl-ACP methyl ester carboxylesterase [Neorhizobium galegae]
MANTIGCPGETKARYLAQEMPAILLILIDDLRSRPKQSPSATFGRATVSPPVARRGDRFETLPFNIKERTIMELAPLTLALASATTLALAMFTPAVATAAPVKNVVLVHGDLADGAGWRGVYEELTKRGYHVKIVQNPLTSLEDDVAATNRLLDLQDGPTILVDHSWGGTVITEAGVHSKVAGLVYVSALAPDAGETTAQQYEGFAPTPEFVLEIGKDGFGFVKPEMFKQGFAHDVSDSKRLSWPTPRSRSTCRCSQRS